MLKNKKITVFTVIIVVIIIAAGAFFVHAHQRPSLLADAKTAVSGYNGEGSIDVVNDLDDEGKLRDDAITAVSNRHKLSKQQIIDLENRKTDSVSPSTVDTMEDELENIKIEFNKSDNLKNGEKVTLSVNDTNSKPFVKNEKKTITIKGLEKTQTLTTQQILKKVKIYAVGFNRHGTLAAHYINKKGLSAVRIKASKFENLKNGDMIKLNFSLKKDVTGAQLMGPRQKTMRIKNLLHISKITNIKAAKKIVLNKVYDSGKGSYTGEGKYKVTANQYFIKSLPKTNMEEKTDSTGFNSKPTHYLDIKNKPVYAQIALGLLSNSNITTDDTNHELDEFGFFVDQSGKILTSKKTFTSDVFENSTAGMGDSTYAKDVIKINKKYVLSK